MLPKLIRSSEMGKKGRKRAMWVLMMIGRREGDDDDDLARVSMLITALTEVAKLERSLRESELKCRKCRHHKLHTNHSHGRSRRLQILAV